MEELLLIALQQLIPVARAAFQTTDPTPEQLAALDAAESAVKVKLTADLEAKANGLGTAGQL